MEPGLARLRNPRFEQGPRAADQALLAGRALEHWLAERELAQQRWRCPRRLRLDYCWEQCCWKMMTTMTWGPRTEQT